MCTRCDSKRLLSDKSLIYWPYDELIWCNQQSNLCLLDRLRPIHCRPSLNSFFGLDSKLYLNWMINGERIQKLYSSEKIVRVSTTQWKMRETQGKHWKEKWMSKHNWGEKIKVFCWMGHLNFEWMKGFVSIHFEKCLWILVGLTEIAKRKIYIYMYTWFCGAVVVVIVIAAVICNISLIWKSWTRFCMDYLMVI